MKINKLVSERRKKENKRERESRRLSFYTLLGVGSGQWAVAGETGINLLEHPSQIAALIDHSR